jgi:5-methylcytosine-specific restriction protein A
VKRPRAYPHYGMVNCTRHGSRARSTQPERSSVERARRRKVVADWVAVHGWVCPGYLVPPHSSKRLQADHVQPVSLGGDPGGELGVLCIICNTRKGGRNRVRFPSKGV